MNRTEEWKKAREKLKLEYLKRGIMECEIRLPGCTHNNYLGFAHRHKRSYYYDEPELLGSFDETVLSCNHCHDAIEYDKKLTEEVFELLRPIGKN